MEPENNNPQEVLNSYPLMEPPVDVNQEVQKEEDKQAESDEIQMLGQEVARAPFNPQDNYYKASQFQQPPELTTFLKDLLANPFNKYCIDCKKNQTTHALIWLGIFVCKQCAENHRFYYGGQSTNYIKDIYNDHWDDYQLKSIQVGGNKPLFEILKEYGMQDWDLPEKYRHACVGWYRKSHIAKLDGFDFTTPKPPKDWNERIQLTKSQIAKESVQWQANLKVIGGAVKDGGNKAGTAIARNATWLNQKLAEQKLGEKIKSMMKKDGTRNSQPVVEPALVEGENAMSIDPVEKEAANAAVTSQNNPNPIMEQQEKQV